MSNKEFYSSLYIGIAGAGWQGSILFGIFMFQISFAYLTLWSEDDVER